MTTRSALQAAVAQVDPPGPIQQTRGTMDQEQFTAYLAMQGLADASIRNYRAMMMRWCDYATAHDRDPMTPDPLTVRAFASGLPGTRSLRAHARATIGHLCRALDVYDVSPAIPLPREPRRQPRGLDPADAKALAAHAHGAGTKGLAVLVGLYTAARRSEIASLAWPRIDIQAGMLTLDRTKTRDLHTVPMHPVLGQLLADRRVPGEQWVFPGRYGGHVSPATVWAWVIEVAETAGVASRVTPHRLRHTALTVANDATGDLRAVQDLAGHTDPSVTARYTATSARRMSAAVAALEYGT